MQTRTTYLLIPFGIVFIFGCAGLKPPADMATYLRKSSDEALTKRAKQIAPKLMKAAEQNYTKAKEACDDSEQEMCDHYSTMAKIILETALDKVAIVDAKKQLAKKMASIKMAKTSLETEKTRQAAYEQRIAGAKKIQQLQAQLAKTNSAAEKQRMQHELEMKQRAAELQKVQSKYSQQKGQLDVLAERTKLVEEAAAIVGNDAVKQTANGIVVTVRELFDRKKTEVEVDGIPTCEAIAKLILKYPRYPILIEGHTDSRGSDSSNLAKSQARAQSVMNQFIQFKVPISRMTATGHGEGSPISDNRTKEGKALNRRVEVKFIYPTN